MKKIISNYRILSHVELCDMVYKDCSVSDYILAVHNPEIYKDVKRILEDPDNNELIRIIGENTFRAFKAKGMRMLLRYLRYIFERMNKENTPFEYNEYLKGVAETWKGIKPSLFYTNGAGRGWCAIHYEDLIQSVTI